MVDSRQINRKPRRIMGLSLDPKIAADFKAEAAKREMSLTKLFQEMWGLYQEARAVKP